MNFSETRFISLFIGQEEFIVEIAETEEEKITGLMFRKKIPDNFGMLFLYEGEDFRGMWMKNTLIHLDLIFLNSNREIVDIRANVPPCTMEPCETYISRKKAKYVLELKGNRSRELKLKTGDSLFFIPDKK